MSWVGVVTDVGNDAILNAIAMGAAIEIDSAQVGSGTVQQVNMHSSTSLVSYVGTANISSIKNEDDGARVRIVVGPGTSAYTLKEIGVFATMGSSSVLMFLMQNDDGISIPAASGFPDFSYTVSALFNIGEAEMDLTIDPDAYVAQSDFEIAIGNMDDAKIDIDQGVSNAGKFLIVGNDGMVVPTTVPFANGGTY